MAVLRMNERYNENWEEFKATNPDKNGAFYFTCLTQQYFSPQFHFHSPRYESVKQGFQIVI